MDDKKILHAKGLYVTAPNELQWLDEVLPSSLGPTDVLLQTRTGSISIGSELPLILPVHEL